MMRIRIAVSFGEVRLMVAQIAGSFRMLFWVLALILIITPSAFSSSFR